MKTLYLDCGMGAAGDMLTAALVGLLPDPDRFIDRLNALAIPGVHTEMKKVVRSGICGTQISVTVHGIEEGNEEKAPHPHGHREHHVHHDDQHGHEHHHSGIEKIKGIITGLDLPANVQADVLSVYSLIAEAESHAHGVPVSQIHFHEVGTMDAIADITAVCLLMDELKPDQVVTSPIHVGSGHVRCAHGILPVPAPATAHILKGVPIYGGEIKGELCTPTGAALLKHFTDHFGAMPILATEAIGYGMGKREFETVNCVRALFGEGGA